MVQDIIKDVGTRSFHAKEPKPPQWFHLLTELLVLATMTINKGDNRTCMMVNPTNKTENQL